MQVRTQEPRYTTFWIDARSPAGATRLGERRPTEIEVSANGVHVFGFPLSLPDAEVARLASVLTPDERDRARRFKAAAARERFIVSRGRLRELLGSFAAIEPAHLRLSTGEYGKPQLESAPALRFNASRTEGLGIVAIRIGDDVGADVECLRPVDGALDIAEIQFTEAESRRLAQAPSGLSDRRFLECWTRKEAVVKALGRGLSQPLNSFEVTARTSECVSVPDAGQWTVCGFEPAIGYVAAIATTALD